VRIETFGRREGVVEGGVRTRAGQGLGGVGASDGRDNGVGTTDTTPGTGLRDLQRRATDVAGSLTVSGARGAGTHLTWTAPVP